MAEKKLTSVKQDEMLKNLMIFNQKILQDKDNNEGVFEITLHSSGENGVSASTFSAVPKENVYLLFELLLAHGVKMFDVDGSLSALGLSTDTLRFELFYTFMRILTEKTLATRQLGKLEEIEKENPQVRDFIQRHIQALVSSGILGGDQDLDLGE